MSLSIRLRLFAMQRAQLGRRSVDLELPEGSTVGDAWWALVALYPELGAGTDSLRFARNGQYADREEVLAAGDEVAVIPPVSGGADVPPQVSGGADGDPAPVVGDAGLPSRAGRRLELTEGPLDDSLPGRLRREVTGPTDGAVALFLGQARETPGTPGPGEEAQAARFAGQRVVGLDYEAFEPMALAVLGDIADEIEARFEVGGLAIVHRIGEVTVGEASVVIAVAAPHREAAFAACRYAIEELKARVPIWKAERFADGQVWTGTPARHGPEGGVEPRTGGAEPAIGGADPHTGGAKPERPPEPARPQRPHEPAVSKRPHEPAGSAG
jgi:MoaE-MoaD fusion protein